MNNIDNNQNVFFIDQIINITVDFHNNNNFPTISRTSSHRSSIPTEAPKAQTGSDIISIEHLVVPCAMSCLFSLPQHTLILTHIHTLMFRCFSHPISSYTNTQSMYRRIFLGHTRTHFGQHSIIYIFQRDWVAHAVAIWSINQIDRSKYIYGSFKASHRAKVLCRQ